jgi:hypothetical protein
VCARARACAYVCMEREWTEYKWKCTIVERQVQKINRESWDKYISDTKHDVHGAQSIAFKL